MPAAALRRIVYRSRSRLLGSAIETAAEFARILESSRRRNAESSLTGALMLREASFAQVLEGPPQAVAATLARIGADPRHDTIEMLEDHPVDLRAFAEWSMAYAGDIDTADIPLTLSFAGLMLNPTQSAILSRLRACLGAGNGAPSSV